MSVSNNPYKEFNQLINNIFYDYSNTKSIQTYLVNKFGDETGYYASTYVRDLFLGILVYYLTAGLWHYTIYVYKGKELFVNKGRPFPETSVIIDQIQLAQSSLFLYAALPIISEYLIENNYTMVYYNIGDIGGLGYYFLYLFLYIACVEVGIYWMHRKLHTNKYLYKYVHGLHHKYNKSSTLTPWASLAFNPLDGLLQACPYVICLLFVPVHYFTHVFLLFFSGVWATNIHDSTWGDFEPVMGSKYHTVHHTHYHYNFGQFFIFCDWIFGTLKVPEKSKFD